MKTEFLEVAGQTNRVRILHSLSLLISFFFFCARQMRITKKLSLAAHLAVALLITPGHAIGQDLLTFTTLSSWNYPSQLLMDTTPLKVDPTGVPTSVWAYDGEQIYIEGLVLPLDYDKDGSSIFILTLDQDTCEFGIMPRINEWILVSMAEGKRVRLRNGFPYRITGTFHVTEKASEGRVVELFAIDGESVSPLM